MSPRSLPMLVFAGIFGVMMLSVALSFITTVPAWIDSWSVEETPHYSCNYYGECDPVEVDVTDTASLQRGLGTFVHYCLACHSARYQRYEAVANDLNIPHDLFKELVMPADKKLSDYIQSSLSDESAATLYGNPVPDLTHQVRARGPEYIYTYLRTFYKDPTQASGSNNLVLPNAAMPNVFLNLQGEQICDKDGCRIDATSDIQPQISPEEFDQKVADLVNFLHYLSEPIARKRERIGGFVLLYILALTILLALTYREYKKDIA